MTDRKFIESLQHLLHALNLQERQLDQKRASLNAQMQKMEVQTTSLTTLCSRLEQQKHQVGIQLKEMRDTSQKLDSQLASLGELKNQLEQRAGQTSSILPTSGSDTDILH